MVGTVQRRSMKVFADYDKLMKQFDPQGSPPLENGWYGDLGNTP